MHESPPPSFTTAWIVDRAEKSITYIGHLQHAFTACHIGEIDASVNLRSFRRCTNRQAQLKLSDRRRNIALDCRQHLTHSELPAASTIAGLRAVDSKDAATGREGDGSVENGGREGSTEL